MKRKLISVLIALAFCLTMTVTVCAAPFLPVGEALNGELPLYDEAQLLTKAEQDELGRKLLELSLEYNVEFTVITVPSITGSDVNSYARDRYNAMYGKERDGVLLLVCMDPRYCSIVRTGLVTSAISDDATDDLTDEIASYLSEGSYCEAFHAFADGSEYYINGHLNGFPFEFGMNLIIALVIGLVVGLITVLILRGQLKTVRQRHEADVYIKSGSMQVTTQKDIFLYRNVTRIKKQTNNTSSSGPSQKVSGRSF